jgi:hypothetical protein
MKAKLKKKLTLLFVLALVLSLFVGLSLNAAAEDDTTYLAFSSDVHYSTSYTQNNLDVWLGNMTKVISKVERMGFCGDMGSAYAANATDYWNYAQAVMDTVNKYVTSGFFSNEGIYTFGNHEWFTSAGGDYSNNKDNPAAKKLVRVGEAVKTDKYIIYCFGPASMSQEYTKDDIAALEKYLETAPNNIPVFVLTHYPLHYMSSRVSKNAADVVEVLNNYPNVVYLWGHNHTVADPRYDNFYKAGDKIEVAKGNELAINFTYAAAGCMSDLEYHSGNGSVKGKGLIVGINGSKVDFKYYTMGGSPLDAALTVDMSALATTNKDGPFTVTFKDGVDSSIIDKQTVAKGSSAKEPAVPSHDGYTFKGWNKEFKTIDKNITITAEYEKIKIDLGEKKLVDNLYVEFPDLKGPIFSFTNVLNQYYNNPEFQYGAITYLFFGDNATLSWNKNVKIYLAGAEAPEFKPGKTYTIDQLNGYYFYNEDKSQFYFFTKVNDATYDPSGASSNEVNGLLTAYATSAPVAPKVVATKQAITIDGKAVNTEVYNIDGSNYFKLRDIAYMLNGTGSQFSIAFDQATNTIQTKTGEAYTAQGTEMAVGADNSKTAVISSQNVTVNGKAAALSAFNIGGYNFFKLVDLSAALKFDVAYDEATKTVAITSKVKEEPKKTETKDKGEAVGKVYFFAVIDADIATDKDGKQIVYYPVAIYKDDTIEDAITTLNATACGDGTAWAYDEDKTYGYYLTKLLGKDVGSLTYGGGGIWTDFSAGKHADIKSAVKDGMIIYLNLHTGSTLMRTGYFDKQYVELKAGDSLTLTFNRCSGDGAVKLCTSNEIKVNGEVVKETTDATSAQVTLKFDKAGEYVVTGTGKNSYGTGVCYVVVK